MRVGLLTAAVLAAAFAAGCGNTSPTGGNPSTPTKADKFTVKAPMMATAIKQGDRQTVTLTLDRGSDFKEAVSLAAEAPKGLKADLSSKTVQPGEPADVTLTIEAEKDAAIADHVVKVTATPKTGNATSVDVKVKVEQKK